MPQSLKIGIACLLLMGVSLIPLFWQLHLPISFIFAVISCVLGFTAARQDSKWWLLIPCILLAGSGFLIYVVLHAA